MKNRKGIEDEILEQNKAILAEKGLTKEEIDNLSQTLDEIIRTEKILDADIYESVEELGASDPDNDLREEDEDDWDWGHFLISIPGENWFELDPTERVVYLYFEELNRRGQRQC